MVGLSIIFICILLAIFIGWILVLIDEYKERRMYSNYSNKSKKNSVIREYFINIKNRYCTRIDWKD